MPNSDYRCRPATVRDDIARIARYIHLTDPYIYPHITPDPDDREWTELIRRCSQKSDDLFSLRHISVVTHRDTIVGIACVIPCGQRLSFAADIPIPDTLASSIGAVMDGYFTPLLEESQALSGWNIVNICIDSDHRRKGVGKLLLDYCIRQYGSGTIHLDAIAANAAAVSLYRRAGFTVGGEYFGFSGDDSPLPCYHMIKHAK